MKDSINRRDFMKRTAAAGIGLSLANGLSSFGQSAPSQGVVGANNKLRAAVYRTHGRGMAHIECLTGIDGVEIAYICDVDKRAVAKGVKQAAKGQGTEPKGLGDFRKALEDK